MIQKKQSRSLAKLQYLFAIPLTFAMLVFVANVSANTIQNKVSEASATSVENTANVEIMAENSENQPVDFPFAVVDQVPLFKGCEELSETEQKNCTSEKINEFVNNRFNEGIKGDFDSAIRVVVQFRINSSGKVEAARARAILAGNNREVIEAAAVKAVEALPQLIPGEHNSEKVNVIYSLPITLNEEM